MLILLSRRKNAVDMDAVSNLACHVTADKRLQRLPELWVTRHCGAQSRFVPANVSAARGQDYTGGRWAVEDKADFSDEHLISHLERLSVLRGLWRTIHHKLKKLWRRSFLGQLEVIFSGGNGTKAHEFAKFAGLQARHGPENPPLLHRDQKHIATIE